VVNHVGQYDAYLAMVNKEIEEGERELASRRTTHPREATRPSARATSDGPRTEQMVRKEMRATERLIAQLDVQKRALATRFEQACDPDEAVRLDSELAAVAAELGKAEDRWSELSGELEALD
jgi:hypothetical protein